MNLFQEKSENNHFRSVVNELEFCYSYIDDTSLCYNITEIKLASGNSNGVI